MRPFLHSRIALGLLVGLVTPALSAIEFEDVSATSGLTMKGTTYGASWGDFNGNGWPDLWVGNHDQHPSLYLNMKDGTFREMAREVWAESDRTDYHGAAWADFDADGDKDLIVLVDAEYQGAELIAGIGREHLLVNDSAESRLVEEGGSRGLTDMRFSRTPLWLDINGDRRLDLLIVGRGNSGKQGTGLYQQTQTGSFSLIPMSFKERRSSRKEKLLALVDSLLDFNFEYPVDRPITAHQESAQLLDLNRDGKLDLVLASHFLQVFDVESGSLEDITHSLSLPEFDSLVDFAGGDFNGDGTNDLVVTQGSYRSSDVIKVGDHAISATLLGHSNAIESSDAKGFDFGTQGSVSFEIGPDWFSLEKVYISGVGAPSERRFTLNPEDVSAISDEILAEGALVFGYDKAAERWQVRNSVIWEHADLVIVSQSPVFLIDYQQMEPFEPQGDLQLALAHEGDFIVSKKALDDSSGTSCFSLAAGDFDNDMDLDFYAVCSGPISNLPNRLYENDGRGVFKLVEDAGGAAGSPVGRGDVVATADFDRDGFLDLLVTNGADPSSPFVQDGPHQLFHNKGNANGWLLLDLVGTKSNIEGIGATIDITAGGILQRREQNGGIHRFTQNHSRIHFGLANNAVVDEIVIRWPSGESQILKQIQANQVLTITEP